VEIRLTASCDLPEIPPPADKRAAGSPVSLCVAESTVHASRPLIRQSMGYLLTRETAMAGVSHRTFTTHRLNIRFKNSISSYSSLLTIAWL
jgi:hypothetical protein